MPDSPYLTVKEASAALGITEDGVRKLIRRKKLRAIKRSERTTLIPRPAFDAYVRRLNGETVEPLGAALPVGVLSDRLAAFEHETGKSPHSWLSDWLDDKSPEHDTADSMSAAVSAVALVAEQRAQANHTSLSESVLAAVTARTSR